MKVKKEKDRILCVIKDMYGEKGYMSFVIWKDNDGLSICIGKTIKEIKENPHFVVSPKDGTSLKKLLISKVRKKRKK